MMHLCGYKFNESLVLIFSHAMLKIKHLIIILVAIDFLDCLEFASLLVSSVKLALKV